MSWDMYQLTPYTTDDGARDPRFFPSNGRLNLDNGNKQAITGTTKVDGVATRCLVSLYDQWGRCHYRKRSKADGSFEIKYLPTWMFKLIVEQDSLATDKKPKMSMLEGGNIP